MESYALGDPQIGYDGSLGRWVASELEFDPSGASAPNIYFAASTGNSASGQWIRWSAPACATDPNYPLADQPLLGWSNGLVAIDVKCFSVPTSPKFGEDNLFLIPNSTITSSAPSLPSAIQPPCNFMAPARDEAGEYTDVYLVNSVIPTFGQISTCGVTSANTSAYIVEYTADPSGVFGANPSAACPSGSVSGGTACAPAATSPQNGVAPEWRPSANATQACPSGSSPGSSACPYLDPDDARIMQAQIRMTETPNGSAIDPYLSTGFSAGMNNGQHLYAQGLWFIQDVKTNSWTTLEQWQTNYWYTYPTIAMDNDEDIYLVVTDFSASIFPSTFWWAYKPLSPGPGFLAKSTLETGGGTYTGDGDGGVERWGDFQTMVFDPDSNPKSPSGEGAFWQIEEYTAGGTDEGSTWEGLADPVPFFVGSAYFESECSSGSPCSITVTTPSANPNGDVLLVALDNGSGTSSPPTVPAGWTVFGHVSTFDNCSFPVSTWLLGYIVGSALPDNHTYTFSQAVSPDDTCLGQFYGELNALAVEYRGEGRNLSNYGVSGSALSGDSSSYSTGNVPVTPETTLLIIFDGPVGSEPSTQPETGDNPGSFTSITGSPTLTPESGLTNVIQFLAADAAVPPSSSGTFGPYSTSVAGGCNYYGGYGCLWTSFQVAIPEF